jgi:hypothetical protein
VLYRRQASSESIPYVGGGSVAAERFARGLLDKLGVTMRWATLAGICIACKPFWAHHESAITSDGGWW